MIRLNGLILCTALFHLGHSAEYADSTTATLKKYCTECHNSTKKKGSLDIEQLLKDGVQKHNTDIWSNIVLSLEDGDMPPPKHPQPSPEASHATQQNITAAIGKFQDPRDPGIVGIRRLTSRELEQSLLAITGITLPVQGFMPNEIQGGEGFSNLASIQDLSEEHLEAMIRIADVIAQRLVLYDENPFFTVKPYPAQSQTDSEAYTERLRALEHVFQIHREQWLLDCATRLVQAGHAVLNGQTGEEAAQKFQISLRHIKTLAALTTEDLPALSKKSKETIDKGGHLKGASSKMPELPIRALKTGMDTLAKPKAVSQAEYRHQSMLLARFLITVGKQTFGKTKGKKRFPHPHDLVPHFKLDSRSLSTLASSRKNSAASIDSLFSGSPQYLKPDQKQTWNSIRAVVKRQWDLARSSQKDKSVTFTTEAELAQRDWLLQLATQVWRKPLANTDKAGILAFYTQERQHRDHEQAMRQSIRRLFLSPHFWYLIEHDSGKDVIHPLNAHELGNRLSYFLWSGPPDAELRRHMLAGSLLKPDILRTQMQRMLQNKRAAHLVDACFLSWLGLAQFRDDPRGSGRNFSHALATEFYQEAHETVLDLLRNNGKVDDLLCGDWTYLNNNLSIHYGMPYMDGWHMRKTQVSQHGRGGLINQAAYLTVTSRGASTSAILRGSWLLSEVLGRHLPPPPANVADLPKPNKGKNRLSNIEILKLHSSEASCAACHKHIDPLGIPFECYNSTGQLLSPAQLKRNQIRTDSKLADGRIIQGMNGLRAYLQDESYRFRRQCARKLLGFALARSLRASDTHWINQMLAASADQDGRLWPMIETIVMSEPFRLRRGSAAVTAQ